MCLRISFFLKIIIQNQTDRIVAESRYKSIMFGINNMLQQHPHKHINNSTFLRISAPNKIILSEKEEYIILIISVFNMHTLRYIIQTEPPSSYISNNVTHHHSIL